MGQDEISGYADFNARDPNAPVNKTGQVKKQPEKVAESSYYSSSTIKKSDTEALVLSLASGFPVLQPPPKTQSKNPYESSSVSIGGTEGGGGVQIAAEGFTQAPLFTDQTQEASSFISKSVIDLQSAVKMAKDILAILIHDTSESDQLSKEEAAFRQLDRLILSTMAMNMVYRVAYGGMSGQEFADLVNGGAADMPEQIKDLINQFSIFIKANLPKDAHSRSEIMRILMTSVDQNEPIATTLEAMRFLTQKLGGHLSTPQSVESTSPADIGKHFQVQQAQNSIIDWMWSTYSKNLNEFSSRMQGEDIAQWLQEVSANGTQSATEYYAYLLALSSTQSSADMANSNALIEKFAMAFNYWINQPNQSLSNAKGGAGMSGAYPSSAFLAGCVICGADILRNVTGGMPKEAQLQSPVADVLFAAGRNSDLLPDYQAAAALIAALLSNGAAYKATDDTLKKGSGDEPPKDLDFAINYAKHIIAIVSHKPAESELRIKEIQEQNRLVRLMLSAMALNMLYRAAYGGMTGEEFGSILKGETQDIHAKIKPYIDQLAFLIKANLSKTEKARTETIVRLMDYVDTKDSINSMLKTTRILANLLPTEEMELKRWEVSG